MSSEVRPDLAERESQDAGCDCCGAYEDFGRSMLVLPQRLLAVETLRAYEWAAVENGRGKWAMYGTCRHRSLALRDRPRPVSENNFASAEVAARSVAEAKDAGTVLCFCTLWMEVDQCWCCVDDPSPFQLPPGLVCDPHALGSQRMPTTILCSCDSVGKGSSILNRPRSS